MPLRRVLQAGAGLCLSLLASPVVVAAVRNAPREVSPASSFVQTLFGLLLVVGIIIAFAWVLRRLGRVPGAGSGVVRVLGGASLGPRERVVLLEVGRTQLLVGLAPGRVQTLHVLDEPVDVKTPVHPGQAGGGFPARLAALLRDRGRS